MHLDAGIGGSLTAGRLADLLDSHSWFSFQISPHRGVTGPREGDAGGSLEYIFEYVFELEHLNVTRWVVFFKWQRIWIYFSSVFWCALFARWCQGIADLRRFDKFHCIYLPSPIHSAPAHPCPAVVVGEGARGTLGCGRVRVPPANVAVLRRCMPAAIRSANFLSGGQSLEDAAARCV